MPVHGPRQIIGSTTAPDDSFTPEPPTLEIIYPDFAVSRLQRVWSVQFVFSQPITDFDLADDVETAECTLSNLEGQGRFWTATLTLNANALQAAEIKVLADSVNWADGTAPASDVVENFMYDTRNIPDPGIGNVSWSRSFDYSAMPDLDDVLQSGETSGGAYAGGLEIETLGNYAYIVVQLQKYGILFELSEQGVPTTERTVISTRQAGAGFYRVNLANGDYTLLKAYPSVSIAARSLLAHDNKVFFLEGSYQCYLNEGDIFTDTQNNNTRYLVNRLAGVPPNWKSMVGRLKYVENGSDDIHDVGLNWVSALPTQNPQGNIDNYYGIHGGTATPLIADGDDLLMVTGYGKLDDVSDAENEVSRADNWSLVRYGAGLNRRIPLLETNGRRGFDIIRDFAILTDSILGIDSDVFFFQPRSGKQAKLNQILDASSAGNIAVNEFNEDFSRYPAEGTVAVGRELIQYTDIDANSINTYTRGYKNTGVLSHALGDKLHFIDWYLTISNLHRQNPITDIETRFETSGVYNHIVINYHSGSPPAIATDPTSIAKYGVLEFNRTVALGISYEVWAKSVADALLEKYKDATTFVEVELMLSTHISVGDIIFLHIPNRLSLAHTLKVNSLSHYINVDNPARSRTTLKLLDAV